MSALWPPLMCPKCFGMKFFCNEFMAQCIYCGRIIMNWSRNESGSVEEDQGSTVIRDQ